MSKSGVFVVGAGPAGLAAALAVGRAGHKVFLIGGGAGEGPKRSKDTRTAALFPSSIAFLRHLGVFDAVQSASVPLRGIRIIDDTGGLLRAPEITFEAHELGRADFGYNVPNSVLVASLEAAVAATPGITRCAGPVTRVTCGQSAAMVALQDGTVIETPLVVGADGHRSVCRAGAGIETSEWAYPQIAIATQFTHTRPHGGLSTEFHRSGGPCTTVPMPGLASSLVWVERPAIARRILALDDAAFASTLEARLHGLLGSVVTLGERRAFPLSGMTAQRIGQNRVALVGEAAHVLPPIGAQGLNLGLRDAATIAELVIDARSNSGDAGAPAVLEAYHQARSADIAMRVNAVDVLNRSLLMDALPSHLARGLGLHMIAAFDSVKQWAMTNGMQPDGQLPRMMRA